MAKIKKTIKTLLLFLMVSSFTNIYADVISDKFVNGTPDIWIDLNNDNVEDTDEIKTDWTSSEIEDNKDLVKSIYLTDNVDFSANDLNYLNDNYQNIEQLTINNNILNDEIVDISDLTKLKYLTINNSSLKNIIFKNNDNIVKIDLKDNVLESFDFSGDTNLLELYLNNNYLSEISTISDSSKLQLLDLSGNNNNIASITSISNMSDLSTLNLDVTDIQKTDTSDGRALAGSNFCLNSSIATDYKDNKEYKEYLQICDDENSFLYALADDYTTYSVWVDLDEDNIIDDGEEKKSWDVNTLIDNTDKIKSIKNSRFYINKMNFNSTSKESYNYYGWYKYNNGRNSFDRYFLYDLKVENNLDNLKELNFYEKDTSFFVSNKFNDLLGKSPNLKTLMLNNYNASGYFDFSKIPNIKNLSSLDNLFLNVKEDYNVINLDYLKDLNLKTFIDISYYYNFSSDNKDYVINSLPDTLEVLHLFENYGTDYSKFTNLKSFTTYYNYTNIGDIIFGSDLYEFSIDYIEEGIYNIDLTPFKDMNNLGKTFIFNPTGEEIQGVFFIDYKMVDNVVIKNDIDSNFAKTDALNYSKNLNEYFYYKYVEPENLFTFAVQTPGVGYYFWIDYDDDDIKDVDEVKLAQDFGYSEILNNKDKVKEIYNDGVYYYKYNSSSENFLKINYHNNYKTGISYYKNVTSNNGKYDSSYLNGLEQFTNLERLEMNEYKDIFQDGIFNDVLNKLTNLKEIGIYNTSEIFNFDNISNISNLDKLEGLNLKIKSNTSDLHLERIKDLPLKRFSSFYYNFISGDTSSYLVDNLPDTIEELYLYYLDYADLSKFSNLKNLTLTYENVNFSDINISSDLYNLYIGSFYNNNEKENLDLKNSIFNNMTNLGKNYTNFKNETVSDTNFKLPTDYYPIETKILADSNLALSDALQYKKEEDGIGYFYNYSMPDNLFLYAISDTRFNYIKVWIDYDDSGDTTNVDGKDEVKYSDEFGYIEMYNNIDKIKSISYFYISNNNYISDVSESYNSFYLKLNNSYALSYYFDKYYNIEYLKGLEKITNLETLGVIDSKGEIFSTSDFADKIKNLNKLKELYIGSDYSYENNFNVFDFVKDSNIEILGFYNSSFYLNDEDKDILDNGKLKTFLVKQSSGSTDNNLFKYLPKTVESVSIYNDYNIKDFSHLTNLKDLVLLNLTNGIKFIDLNFDNVNLYNLYLDEGDAVDINNVKNMDNLGKEYNNFKGENIVGSFIIKQYYYDKGGKIYKIDNNTKFESSPSIQLKKEKNIGLYYKYIKPENNFIYYIVFVDGSHYKIWVDYDDSGDTTNVDGKVEYGYPKNFGYEELLNSIDKIKGVYMFMPTKSVNDTSDTYNKLYYTYFNLSVNYGVLKNGNLLSNYDGIKDFINLVDFYISDKFTEEVSLYIFNQLKDLPLENLGFHVNSSDFSLSEDIIDLQNLKSLHLFFDSNSYYKHYYKFLNTQYLKNINLKSFILNGYNDYMLEDYTIIDDLPDTLEYLSLYGTKDYDFTKFKNLKSLYLNYYLNNDVNQKILVNDGLYNFYFYSYSNTYTKDAINMEIFKNNTNFGKDYTNYIGETVKGHFYISKDSFTKLKDTSDFCRNDEMKLKSDNGLEYYKKYCGSGYSMSLESINNSDNFELNSNNVSYFELLNTGDTDTIKLTADVDLSSYYNITGDLYDSDNITPQFTDYIYSTLSAVSSTDGIKINSIKFDDTDSDNKTLLIDIERTGNMYDVLYFKFYDKDSDSIVSNPITIEFQSTTYIENVLGYVNTDSSPDDAEITYPNGSPFTLGENESTFYLKLYVKYNGFGEIPFIDNYFDYYNDRNLITYSITNSDGSNNSCLNPVVDGNGKMVLQNDVLIEFDKSCAIPEEVKVEIKINNINSGDDEENGGNSLTDDRTVVFYVKAIEPTPSTSITTGTTDFGSGLILTMPLDKDSKTLIRKLKKEGVTTNNIDKMITVIKDLQRTKEEELNKEIKLNEVLDVLDTTEIEKLKEDVKLFLTVTGEEE